MKNLKDKNSVINTLFDQRNLKTKIEESVTNSKETRKEYLDSLGGN